MAAIDFIGQPFDGSIGKALRSALEDTEAVRFRAAVAWGKASGLSRLGHAITQMRDRHPGNEVTLFVGVDEGGATWEGLDLARQVSTRAYIFHDAGSRTYHPKLYVVEAGKRATVVCGSGNATKGGFFTNYECATIVHLEIAEPGDCVYLDKVNSYFDRLEALSGSCLLIDDELLERLEDSTLNIKSEAVVNRRRAQIRASTSSGLPIFESVKGLGGAPKPEYTSAEADEADEDALIPPTDSGESSGGGTATSGTATGFYKRLGNNDVSTHGSPGQIIIPIRFKSFFPQLTVQRDDLLTGGARQSEALFPAKFRDGTFEKDLPAVRAILYEPKAAHPRRNVELRFTFRDRSVLDRFTAGDVIVFSHQAGTYTITRQPPTAAPGPKRFDWLD